MDKGSSDRVNTPQAGRPAKDAERGSAGSPAMDAAAFGLPAHPACPFCSGHHTELHSPFGPQLSVASYWCSDCHTAFELLKWRS